MVQEKRSLHLRLQEYCDCYLESDPQAELEMISREGIATESTGDPEELALKFLSVAILYSINERVKTLKLEKKDRGEVRFKIKGDEKHHLPPPPPQLADTIFEVMRSITHLEGGKGSELLSLGLKNDSLELGIKLISKPDKQSLKISFPEL